MRGNGKQLAERIFECVCVPVWFLGLSLVVLALYKTPTEERIRVCVGCVFYGV